MPAGTMGSADPLDWERSQSVRGLRSLLETLVPAVVLRIWERSHLPFAPYPA